MTHLPSSQRRIFELRGVHVLLICIVFFAAIFAVNGVLVYAALSSFPGVERMSSYQAGRNFPNEIERARAQGQRHWKVGGELRRSGDQRVEAMFSFTDEKGTALDGLAVSLRLQHPARSDRDVAIDLPGLAGGRYRAVIDGVAAGQWDVVIEARADGDILFRSTNRWSLP